MPMSMTLRPALRRPVDQALDQVRAGQPPIAADHDVAQGPCSCISEPIGLADQFGHAGIERLADHAADVVGAEDAAVDRHRAPSRIGGLAATARWPARAGASIDVGQRGFGRPRASCLADTRRAQHARRAARRSPDGQRAGTAATTIAADRAQPERADPPRPAPPRPCAARCRGSWRPATRRRSTQRRIAAFEQRARRPGAAPGSVPSADVGAIRTPAVDALDRQAHVAPPTGTVPASAGAAMAMTTWPRRPRSTTRPRACRRPAPLRPRRCCRNRAFGRPA